MRNLLKLSAAAVVTVAVQSPAMADIIQVDASSIQGFNVLFNDGVTSGNVVDGFLNNDARSRILFTGADGAILRASGGQARISGDLDASTNPPNDTVPLLGFSAAADGDMMFSFFELNFFGGDADSVTVSVIDNNGDVFNFDNALGNGENRFGFQAIAGQSIRSFSFSTTGGGIDDVRQIRLGVAAGPVAPIPEPAMWAMMIGGFGMVGGAMRRRRTTVSFA